jgi:hypothetical protein
MISKSESTAMTSQASLVGLEQNLGSLSLRYMRQSVELPFNHERQTVLARLYSAANTLHQAVRKGAVENAIFEICSNLIGCEQIALLVMSKRGRVDFIGSAEFKTKQVETLRRNSKRIIEKAPVDSIVIETGKDRSFFSSLGINARVPFSLDSATRGVIVFFDLLPQRNGLDAEDEDLLKLLCTYTGPCLAANKTKQQETSRWVQL